MVHGKSNFVYHNFILLVPLNASVREKTLQNDDILTGSGKNYILFI